MFGRRRHTPAVSLRHVLVAGGSVAEWSSFTSEQWQDRTQLLVEAGRLAGARYVTVRPHEPVATSGVTPSHSLSRRVTTTGGLTVDIDPVVDGRQRICDAVTAWEGHTPLTERRLSRALFGEAGEPDLVVVLDAATVLPRSLVWELAYSEIVFVSAGWAGLESGHLHNAIEEFAQRQRRFGGVE